jgi:hypothetical protein
MNDKPKVALLIATHCPPNVIKVTLGTWLQHYDGGYNAEVYLGLHKNYHHYHPGLDEIKKMEEFVNLVYVDEMDWWENNSVFHGIMRYSKMHAKNLQGMMRAISGKDFTHVAILDHDLVFKDDLVGWMVKEHGKDDVVCALHGDRKEDIKVDSPLGSFVFAPKPSAWHLLIGRRMLDVLVKHPEWVEPGYKDGKVYDTLSLAYHNAASMGLSMGLLTEAEMGEHVEHVWSMSFNYGAISSGNGNYERKLKRFEKEYVERFPNGIMGLLSKLRRPA